MHIYRVTFLTLLLSHHIHALEVTPNSECSSLCDDNASDDPGSSHKSHTKSDDLVCNDGDFSSTAVGRKFTDCSTCELKSTANDIFLNENDVFWALSSMKLTIGWCVLAYSQNSQDPPITEANSRCGQVCSGSDNSTRTALKDSKVLQYCQDEDGAFPKTADDCMKCLNKVPKAKTLANFVHALKAACAQQPQPGEKLKLDFDVFPAVPTPNSSTSTASSAGLVAVTPANPPSSFSAGTVTVVVTSAYPLTPSSAAIAAPSSSREVASASAAASANNRVRVGVGVGVGVGGGVALVLAVTAIILFRGRSTHSRKVFEGEAQARGEAEQLAAHGVPNSNHRPQQEQNVEVAELISPDYSPRVAEFIAPDHWAGVAEFRAPDRLAEADERRLDPEGQILDRNRRSCSVSSCSSTSQGCG
ncbi:hypothetical protein MMC07_005203 [Pseudocyphellaria aurata]|nr:hypothetical protein [Pseudocyphellaria aurata]